MNEVDYFVNAIKAGKFDADLRRIRIAVVDRTNAVESPAPGVGPNLVVGDRVLVSNRHAPWRTVNVTGYVKRVSESTVWVIPEEYKCGPVVWAKLTGYQRVRGFKAYRKHLTLVV